MLTTYHEDNKQGESVKKNSSVEVMVMVIVNIVTVIMGGGGLRCKTEDSIFQTPSGLITPTIKYIAEG